MSTRINKKHQHSEDHVFTINQEIFSDYNEVQMAVNKFVIFLKNKQISSHIIFLLRSIYSEAINNIYLHAQLDFDQQIYIKTVLTEKHAIIQFKDSGIPFDQSIRFEENEGSCLYDKNKSSRFGLKMLHNLSDEIEYSRDNNGVNILTIKKEI